MKSNFLITVTLPVDVTIQRMRRYIEEAVQTSKESMDRDDPMFELQHKHVRVQMLGVKK